MRCVVRCCAGLLCGVVWVSWRLVSRWLGRSPLLVVVSGCCGPSSGGCFSLHCWEWPAVSGWFWCGHAQTGCRAGQVLGWGGVNRLACACGLFDP